MSDKDRKILDEFNTVRDQYNKDLKDLRDKYEPVFHRILEEVKDESSSKETD